jgi:hypothetical protein
MVAGNFTVLAIVDGAAWGSSSSNDITIFFAVEYECQLGLL